MTNRIHRRTVLGIVCTLATCTSFPALAAEPATNYPTKAIKVIVPFPAGGTTDTLMRIIGPRLSKSLGQAVVIENKAGASATVGADFVSKAAPDGYTLLVGAAHHTIAQAVFAKLPYRFERDLAPIGLVALVPNVVVVNATVPAKSVQELIALSKADPDKYNYGSAGPGSAHHLIGEMFKLRTGAKLTHIPYRGSAPAVADLLGGQVSVMFDTVTSALPHIKAQKTKALAVTTAKRSSALSEIPTLAEAGVANFDVGTWFGLLAPAGTPPAIIDKVNVEVTAIVNDPEVRKQLLSQGIEPLTSSPAELKARIATELTEFGSLAKQAKLSVE